MKLKLLAPACISLLFALFYRVEYEETNEAQIPSLYSLVKLKASYNLSGKKSNGDKESDPQLLSVTARRSPPPSPRPSESRNPRTQQRGPLLRMPTWPPASRRTVVTSTTTKIPGKVQVQYKWPPEPPKRRSASVAPSHKPETSDATKPSEDLFTAIKVDISDDNDDIDLSKLAITSSSESDTEQSGRESPIGKETLDLPETSLSPETLEKIKKLKVKCIKKMESALRRRDAGKLIRNPNIARDIVLVPIQLAIVALSKLLAHFASEQSTILSKPKFDVTVINLTPDLDSKHDYVSRSELLESKINDLKREQRIEYAKKYGHECDFVRLKSLGISYRTKYLSQEEINLQIKTLSNPREGKVDNRAALLLNKYSQLKESMAELRNIKIQFLDCYFSYFKTTKDQGSPTRSEKCSWPELLYLLYYSTGFSSLAMIANEALSFYSHDIWKYKNLEEKTPSELTEHDKAIHAGLKPLMDKLQDLRTEYELFDAISSATKTIAANCLSYLKNEN